MNTNSNYQLKRTQNIKKPTMRIVSYTHMDIDTKFEPVYTSLGL